MGVRSIGVASRRLSEFRESLGRPRESNRFPPVIRSHDLRAGPWRHATTRRQASRTSRDPIPTQSTIRDPINLIIAVDRRQQNEDRRSHGVIDSWLSRVAAAYLGGLCRKTIVAKASSPYLNRWSRLANRVCKHRNSEAPTMTRAVRLRVDPELSFFLLPISLTLGFAQFVFFQHRAAVHSFALRDKSKITIVVVELMNSPSSLL